MPRISRPQFDSVVNQIASERADPTTVRLLFDEIDDDSDGFVSYAKICEVLEELSEEYQETKREARRRLKKEAAEAAASAAAAASLLLQSQAPGA